VVAGPDTPEFLRGLADRLCAGLSDDKRPDGEFHREIANCLIAVAQSAAPYEDFKIIQRIGTALQNSRLKDPELHGDCCCRALQSLLPPSAADRLVELYLENPDDAAWGKTVSSLLALVGPLGGERAVERLAEEPAASNRLRLLRLIEQIGVQAIPAVRRKLTDDRWYVVRNACYLIGRLADPELSTQLRMVLRHPEVRVQQAAITAIIKNQVTSRAEVMAEALPYLKGQVLEFALDELIFLRDPAVAASLEEFLSKQKGSKAGALEKAVKVLAYLSSDRAVEALGKVLADTGQAQTVRRTALVALSCSTSPHAHRLMFKFSRQDPRDELVVECQAVLKVSQP
jgi:hypothetical protein